MLKDILVIIIILTAFPVGYLIAYLCRDELVDGRKWFNIVLTACLILIFLFLLLIDVEQRFVVVFSLIYIGILAGISLKKSFDKKFVKK